ncbi:MAG: O-antigen ligase family protein, partial [Firmicutes bacterium]|nr:O-antigen ligase family protein [Bacillota bacterium]
IDQLNAEGRMIYSIEFEEGEVYSTLYNINYVPFYLCTVLPVIALCFVGLFDKELKLGKTARIVIGAVLIALYGLGLYNFFCANSASGYAGLAVMFLLALIVFRKQLKAWAKPVLCVLLVSAAVIGGLFPRWYPELRKTVKDADFLTSSLFTPVYALTPDDFKNKPASKHCTIDYIVTGEDYVLFSIYGNELYMNYIGGAVSFTDAEDNGVPVYLYNEKTNAYTFLDERFHDYITFRFDNETGVHTLHTRNRDWDFLFTEHTAIYKALSGKWITLHKVDKFGFEGHYSFGSGRGYIWSRSLPLLKDTILIGHGADTFCAYFPNDDYAGKFSTIGWPDWALNTIYDKPHDLYIQTGVNTGVLSLIAQLGIFFFYFRDSLKTGFGLRKKEDQNVSNSEGAPSAVSALGILPYAAMGCFLGVAGYLVVGIFNDSSVSTAPYFYSVLGLGFCINAMIREAEKSGQTEPGAKAA